MNRKERVEKDSITFLAILAIILFLFMGLGTLLAQTSASTTVSNFKLGYASSNENRGSSDSVHTKLERGAILK